MTLDPLWRLESAYHDNCVNYTPDKDIPTGVKSVKLGEIFYCIQCEYDATKDPKWLWVPKDVFEQTCFTCKNRVERIITMPRPSDIVI